MTESRLLQKIIDFIGYTNGALKHFPKYEKYSLVVDIKNSMYKLLKLCIECDKKYYKKTTMRDMDVEVEILRCLFRVSALPEQKYISIKKYGIVSKYLNEIGKMIGSRMKTIK